MTDQAALDRSFARRVAIAVGIVLLAVLSMYLLWRVGYVLLLSFAGILVAVALDGLAVAVQQHTSLKRRWSLALVLITLIVLIGAIGWWLGPYIMDQMNQLVRRLPTSLDNIRSQINHYEWGRMLLRNVPQPSELISQGASMLTQIAGAFSTVVGAITNMIAILVIGMFMAYTPNLYIESAVRLVPPVKRERAHDIVRALGHALRRWFVGRLASMALVGILTYIGLLIIGVPLSLALGFITGLLDFVPFIGPILALVPILLVAFLESPFLALYALMVYGVVQFVESYLIAPLIAERTVDIPPAYLIIVLALGGVLAGIMGLLLATPLAVVVAILVQMLYIEDTLGDSVRVMGERPSESFP